MLFLTFCQWLQDTGPSRAISESTWGYPIIGAVHVLGIGLFGGAGMTLDLRLLGFMMRHKPVAQVARQFRVWKQTGFVVIVLTGLLLFGSAPVRSYNSLFFKIKMLLLSLVGVNTLIFHWQYRRRAQAWEAGDATPIGARISAFISLLLWIGIIFAARGIAFL